MFNLFSGEGRRRGGGGRQRPLSGNHLGGSRSGMLTPSAGDEEKSKTRICNGGKREGGHQKTKGAQ